MGIRNGNDVALNMDGPLSPHKKQKTIFTW